MYLLLEHNMKKHTNDIVSNTITMYLGAESKGLEDITTTLDATIHQHLHWLQPELLTINVHLNVVMDG